MSRDFSTYLDFVRFAAAFLVLLFHANHVYNPGYLITSFGHEAVIIFFVLSGFVIAYVAENKEDSLRVFLTARAARIYSVALPAILLTATLDFTGFNLSPDAYPISYQAWDLPLVRMLTSALFVNEVWFQGIQLFTNVPYWSLNYEVWYYVIFAVSFYLSGARKWALLTLILLFIGPKILLLMPIWWMGVFILRSETLANISIGHAWSLLLVSLAGFTIYVVQNLGVLGWNFTLDLLGADLHKQLAWSRQCFTDYFLGFFLMLHFAALRRLLAKDTKAFRYVEKPVHYLAGATFSLYLFHQPLLWFFSAVFAQTNAIQTRYILVLIATLITALLLSVVTERKKKTWQRLISALVESSTKLISRIRHRQQEPS